MTATERSLSAREAGIVLDLEWRGQKIVSAAELRSMLGGSDGYCKSFTHRLVRKGWLERIRPGLFELVPADRGPDGVTDTNALAAGALIVSPYFYSFATACTHHGFTEQVFTEAYVACRISRRPATVRGTRFVFVPMSEERFFGFDDVDVLGQKVKMATKERAVLDAVDRPYLAGGLPEVSRIVAHAAGRIAWPTVLELAKRWKESAIVQRLGYLLDIHQVPLPGHAREALMALASPTSKVHLGSRKEWGTGGRLVRPWGIIENVPLQRLTEPRTAKRRVRSFDSRTQ
jgi:predicted transcriptional regulator of viral defense system